MLAHAFNFEPLARLESLLIRLLDVASLAKFVEQHVEVAELEGLVLAHFGVGLSLDPSLCLGRAVVFASELLFLGYVARQLSAFPLLMVRRRSLRLMSVQLQSVRLLVGVGANSVLHEGRAADSCALHYCRQRAAQSVRSGLLALPADDLGHLTRHLGRAISRVKEHLNVRDDFTGLSLLSWDN